MNKYYLGYVVVFMGFLSDMEYCKKIEFVLKEFGIFIDFRICLVYKGIEDVF